ncbi:MAG TPA: hypothetical protein VEQ18_05635, partial [Candidatus Nitrosocosmicus sp.]|nr:hypothetical protein [Candidatus Nitrosocosmicus sp.]
MTSINSSIGNPVFISPLTESSKANEGYRLAKIMFRPPRDGSKQVHFNKCAQVPIINIGEVKERVEEFLPHILGLIQNTQDSIIKEAILEGTSSLNSGELSINAVLEFLKSEQSGNRLTKEEIGLWFDVVLADNLAIAFGEKLTQGGKVELSEELVKRIDNTLASYRESFSMLAG